MASHRDLGRGPQTKGDDGGATAEQERDRLLLDQRQMDGRLFDYHSLLRASRALHHCRDMNALAGVLRAMIHDKMGAVAVRIFLYDEAAGVFTLFDDPSEVGDRDAAPFSFGLGPGILWQLLRRGEPFSVVDLDGAYRFPDLFASTGLDTLSAVIWTPLVMDDQPRGLLALGHLPGGAPYSHRELEFLHTLGEQAAVAAASIHLYQRLRSEQARLDRTIRDLSVLYDISRAISQIDNMKQLLLEILDHAIGRVGAERGSIMLYVPDDDLLRMQVVKGLPDPMVEERINSGQQACKTFRPGEGVAGQVFKTGEPYLSHDPSSDKNFTPSGETRVESIACLPLICNDQPMGVLNITNKKESQFCQEDIEILSAIAGQAAMTIEKADLYQLAISDELTGLYVRRYFYRRLDEEARRRGRYGTTVSMLILDIDHFKRFNDTHGHDIGDVVLKEVANALRGQCRDIDVVARYGGEEFAVLLPETDLEGALIAGERLRTKVESLRVPVGEEELSVTISVGACQATDDIATRETLIRASDLALYQAKDGGRNRVVAYEEGMKMPEGG